jgi:hypothetical protein
MAFRDRVQRTDGDPFDFYNVDMAVGPGAPNVEADVMLVQFLLKHFFEMADRKAQAPRGRMKVDGIVGPITLRWITAFQERMRRQGIPMATDGRIDKARGEMSSISKTVYTILVLCGQYDSDLEFGGNPPSRYHELDKELDCPPALAAAVGPPEESVS